MLVVLAGRPGTGKTTLARALAARLRAAYLRIDAIETALGGGIDGPEGYAVAHAIAAGNVALGVPVVVDAVNAVPEARAGWRDLPGLVVLETVLADAAEHRRRVGERQPDLAGQVVPTWEQVEAEAYVPWDEARDGPRHVIDTADVESALAQALAVLEVEA